MLKRWKVKGSPSMIVAIIAVVLATTGSAFAAKQLITGRDIKNGSITRADLADSTVRSMQGRQGRRGPEGSAGNDGLPGPSGSQGSTGPAGPQGPQGPKGEAGDPGLPGSLGQTGRTGPQGRDGPQGPQGPSGLTVGPLDYGRFDIAVTPTEVVPLTSTQPNDETVGLDMIWAYSLTAGVRYRVDIRVTFRGPTPAEPGVAYGVARLFDGSTPIDTIITADIPDDGNNTAQMEYSRVVVGTGNSLTLRGVVRTDSPLTGGTAGADIFVSELGA